MHQGVVTKVQAMNRVADPSDEVKFSIIIEAKVFQSTESVDVIVDAARRYGVDVTVSKIGGIFNRKYEITFTGRWRLVRVAAKLMAEITTE